VFTALAGPVIPYGPYLDEIVFFEEKSEMKMLKAIEKGDAHLWLWPMKTVEGKKYAEVSPEIELIEAFPGCFNFFLNPIDTLPTVGEFNVFAVREIREVFNLYLNREFIIKEFMGGFGIPHFTVFPPVRPDYVRLYPQMKELEARYKYDPAKATEIISELLTKAGARFVAGKWYYGDKPIVVRFFIRIEDVRKPIGDYMAAEIERLGLTVERVYGPAPKAWAMVYGGDPRRGEWHIYTEGWAFTAIAAYDDDLPYYMYTSPWTGTVFEFYTPPPPLPDLATRLLEAKYTSAEERDHWVLKLAEYCLKDSTRVWMVWEAAPFPRHAELVNLIYDLTGGAWSYYTLRSARLKEKIGGSIRVAQFVAFAGAWNTVGGFKWLYDVLIGNTLFDPGVLTHPHTGRYTAIRAPFTVLTAGPGDTLPVPEDAIIFDPAKLAWRKVGPGVKAISAVTYTLNFGKWHHGAPQTLADVMNWVAQMYRINYPEDPLYDPAAVPPAVEVFTTKVKGIKIEAPNVLTVYIDYWHVDETFIAAMASPWPGYLSPWEVIALKSATVHDRKLAFSDTYAKKWKVPWLDLSRGPSLPVLADYLAKLKAVNFIPEYIAEWVTPAEAKDRWTALHTWNEARKHFLVGDGMFYLDKIDPPAKIVVVKANRDYLFKADKFDHLVVPRVPDIAVKPVPEIVPGLPTTVEITAAVAGVPYGEVDIKLLVIDPEGVTVLAKVAKLVAPGLFTVELTDADTAKLMPGTYTLTVIAFGLEAALARVITMPVIVISISRLFEERFKEIDKDMAAISEKLVVVGKEVGWAIKALGDALKDTLLKMGGELGDKIVGTEDRLAKSMEETRKELSDSIIAVSKSVEALTATVSTVLMLVSVAVLISLLGLVLSVYSIVKVRKV